MQDNLLIATLSNRSRYKALHRMVNPEDFGTSTSWIIQQFGKVFDQYPDMQDIDYDLMHTMVALKLKVADDKAPALALLKQARSAKVNAKSIQAVTEQLIQEEYAGDVARIHNMWKDGAEIDLSHELYKATMKVRTTLGSSAASMFEEPDIHAILAEQAMDVGLKFRQLCLQEHVKGITPPLSIGVAAPWDSGKTSLIADIITYFAPQCQKMWPGRPILWLSNEGVVREIWPRVYSAAMGIDGNRLSRMPARELYSAYATAMGGDKHILKMKDAHGWGLAQVAGLVEELKPIMVVFDMLANFKLAGVEKKHEKMEALFQEVREMAALHDFIAISTLQVSAEGFDMLYPPGSAIKDTKVGVQGAVDILLMMGRLDNNPAYANTRGFSLPKNKRKIIGKPGNMQAEVIFNPDTARFTDN